MTDPSADRWPPRPRLSSTFFKAHGLGNDYLVFREVDDPAGEGWWATEANVRRVCHPHHGIGSDGIVVLLADTGPNPPGTADAATERVALRMFNPDGGEFERSGNGLRVLASFLAADEGVRFIDAEVGGGAVRMKVHGRAGPVVDVSVEMGKAAVGPEAIGLRPEAVSGDAPPWSIAGPSGEALPVVPVSVGNPHLVVLADGREADDFGSERLAGFGDFLARHPGIAEGTNVQLARATTTGAEARIWERGVGPTAASGTSACAVAVALVRTGRLAPGEIEVAMPGGSLQVRVTPELEVVLRGPVETLFEGRLFPELLATFEPGP